MKIINRSLYIYIIFIYSFFGLFGAVFPSHAISQMRIRAGFSIYSPPIFFIEQAGVITIRGLSVELASILASNMNSIIEFHAMDNTTMINELNKGNIDFIITVKDDLDGIETVNLIEMNIQIDRKIFINKECMSFSSLKDLSGHVVALPTDNFLSRIHLLQMNIDFIETRNQEEALNLVNSGKAQVYISHGRLLTLDVLKKSGFNNIKEVGTSMEAVPLVIATHKSNLDLHNSLRLAYEKSLKTSSYNRILNKWMERDNPSPIWIDKNIQYFFSSYAKHILIVIGVAILALLGVVLWNYMLKRKVLIVTKNLKISEQKYRDLIESSPDMIHLISRGGEIRLANKIALRHLGYSKEEITSLMLHDLVLPEQAGDMTDFIDRVFLDKYSNKEFTLLAKNGDRINVEVVATIFKEVDSNENLACCFSRDLTERKRLEEELIHSDRLAIMGRMAAGIAHEINNPLWVILSNAEDALTHKLSPEELDECFKSIERSGARAAKSIEDLLTFAKPAPMKFINIDLIRLIEDSLVFLRQKLKKKNIRVGKKYSSESIFLRGDENSIQQLLINIILNAIQALDKDGSIIISVNVIEKNGSREIVLEIWDNGKGIHDEELQYIFNPFFTSGKKNGFGLGLFMSKMIVEKHHGSLSVRSHLGEGTVITVCFPEKTEKKARIA